MLCLSRKTGEGIVIGENIVVRVLKNGKGAVRFGIDAPREIPIRREELLEQMPPAAVEAA